MRSRSTIPCFTVHLVPHLNRQYHAARYQLIQDLCDFVLPMTSLGYFNLNEGVLGLAG